MLVRIKELYSPSLLIPGYWKEGRGRPLPTLSDFGPDASFFLPLLILKEHVESNVLITPPTRDVTRMGHDVSGKFAPAPEFQQGAAREEDAGTENAKKEAASSNIDPALQLLLDIEFDLLTISEEE